MSKVQDVKDVTKAEQDFYYYMNDRGGTFTTNLFKTIMCADVINRSKLAQVFPNEVKVVNNYQYESDYWEILQERVQG